MPSALATTAATTTYCAGHGLVFAAAVLLRIGLMVFGGYQDAHSSLKYTDVDYRVFSDATRHIVNPTAESAAQGWLARKLGLSIGDPYIRETYRYTPLLALLLIPNESLHPSFGKILFAASDIVIGALLFSLSSSPTSSPTRTSSSASHEQPKRSHGLPASSSIYWLSALWLLNPMPANISTRGSSESVLGMLVISTLALAMRRNYDAAAMMLGLSVHFKIYPFIYGASLLASMNSKVGVERESTQQHSPFLRRIKALVTIERVRFALISALSFGIFNIAMYSIWGTPFLEHSYLYHMTRKDHRHNFSPYFYSVYLTYSTTTSNTNFPFPFLARIVRSPLVSFAPQMLLSIGSGFVFGGRQVDLPFAWFVQTAVFVTFNKVCTSQYFMWYLWFLPLVLPRMNLPTWKSLMLLGLWIGAQALWLSFGYSLEFIGEQVFIQLWGASVLFLIVNSYVIVELIHAYN